MATTPPRLVAARKSVTATTLAAVGSALLVALVAATPVGRRVAGSLLGREGKPALVLAVGDMSCGSSDRPRPISGPASVCAEKALSDEALALRPDALLALGDTQYERGSLADFKKFYDRSWGRLLPVTHPAVGNHEYGTSGASGYFDYFGSAAGPRGKAYYSFNVGNWHLIALNSECSKVGGCEENSPQHDWLLRDLDDNDRDCILAYWHEPRFSSGRHGGSTRYLPFWRALMDVGADVVLTGHDHMYERFARQDAEGRADRDHGIREFVVGAGGRNRTQARSPQPNSEVLDDGSYGFLELSLRSSSYTWRYHALPPSTFADSGSQSCH